MFPDAHTIQEFFLEVGDGHQLYVQEWGNARAITTHLFLHGGPGGGTSDSHKKRFDPQQHHVIFFDQRGSGLSLPYGSLEHNTTEHLVKDITLLLDRLKIRTVVLVGGSWGSALALAYAIAHPTRVAAMVLQGIFTGSTKEIEWLDKGLFKTFYPEAWAHYISQTPQNHHHDPTAYHMARVLGTDEQAQLTSAFAYETLESSLMSLDDRTSMRDISTYDPLPMRLGMHYLHNTCFMKDRYILDNAHKLTMPIWLVQGRYDMVCPPETAYELHRNLPQSHLIWTTAGHRSADRATTDVIKTILLQFS